jgi:hypothetical protein
MATMREFVSPWQYMIHIRTHPSIMGIVHVMFELHSRIVERTKLRCKGMMDLTNETKMIASPIQMQHHLTLLSPKSSTLSPTTAAMIARSTRFVRRKRQVNPDVCGAAVWSNVEAKLDIFDMTSHKIESDEHRRTPPNRGVLHYPLVLLLPFSLHPDSNTPTSHPHYRSRSQPRLLPNPNHLHPTTLPSPLQPTLPTRISMSDDRCGTSSLGTFPVQLFERQRSYCPRNPRRDLISRSRMMQIGIPPWMGEV